MQPQPLSRDEAKALLAACGDTTNGIRDRAVFTMLYRGGTRITATLAVRPADIDWDRKLVAIHRDKGGKGRTITLDDEALDVLRLWAERRKSLGVNGHHPFFCATNEPVLGKSLDSSHYRHKIQRLRKKAGIEKRCHCHGLRHTAASEMLEEGFDIATIASQLGHAFTSTTARYLHQLRPDLMHEKLSRRKWADEKEPEPMDQPDEPDPNEANKQLAIAIGALTISLLDKGVISQAEYDRGYAQATVIIDQEFARKRDAQGEPQ